MPSRKVTCPSDKTKCLLCPYILSAISILFSRPAGSEAEVVAGSADLNKSDNPDHVGGFQVAMPIFNGIETKFGLVLPKFTTGVATIPVKKPAPAAS